MTTDTPRTDAELEKPRDGVYSSFFSMASHAKQLERELAASKAEVERLRSALELIAAPKRPDGTYNRCREACETLASKALKPSDK